MSPPRRKEGASKSTMGDCPPRRRSGEGNSHPDPDGGKKQPRSKVVHASRTSSALGGEWRMEWCVAAQSHEGHTAASRGAWSSLLYDISGPPRPAAARLPGQMGGCQIPAVKRAPLASLQSPIKERREKMKKGVNRDSSSRSTLLRKYSSMCFSLSNRKAVNLLLSNRRKELIQWVYVRSEDWRKQNRGRQFRRERIRFPKVPDRFRGR